MTNEQLLPFAYDGAVHWVLQSPAELLLVC